MDVTVRAVRKAGICFCVGKRAARAYTKSNFDERISEAPREELLRLWALPSVCQALG